LSLANLWARYLGEEYPYRNTEIHEDNSRATLAQVLSYDARIICRQAAELTNRISDDLYRLYRNLGLPLMLVLEIMQPRYHRKETME